MCNVACRDATLLCVLLFVVFLCLYVLWIIWIITKATILQYYNVIQKHASSCRRVLVTVIIVWYAVWSVSIITGWENGPTFPHLMDSKMSLLLVLLVNILISKVTTLLPYSPTSSNVDYLIKSIDRRTD